MNLEIEKNEVNIKKEENTLKNDVEINKLIDNEVTVEKQNKFLESTLGKTINTGIDIGLRAVLPDVLEEQIIDIKNAMISSGLKEGINTAIKSAIDIGKSAMGIVTGKFDDLSQVHTAIKKGGIIDSLSNVIDNVLKSSTKNKLMSNGISKLIKKGKNAILDTVSSTLEEKYFEDINSLAKISKYVSNWKNYYNTKNIDGMEKEYKKLKTQLSTVIALDSTISEAKKVENLHNFIKNKGIDYELSEEEKELINILK